MVYVYNVIHNCQRTNIMLEFSIAYTNITHNENICGFNGLMYNIICLVMLVQFFIESLAQLMIIVGSASKLPFPYLNSSKKLRCHVINTCTECIFCVATEWGGFCMISINGS